MKKMVFATKQMQDRPFSIAGRTFFSRLLTGAEEMVMTEYDAMSALTQKRSETLERQVEVLRALLYPRERNEEPVTEDWVFDHLGSCNAARLVAYLRVGNTLKPGETLTLPVLPESIEIADRTFIGRATTFREQHASALAIEALQRDTGDLIEPENALGDVPDDVKTFTQAREFVQETMTELKAITYGGAEQLAVWLNARIPDAAEGQEPGQPIDGAWLMGLVNAPTIGVIATYLSTGEMPEDEEADPNAEDAGEAAAS